MSASERLEAIAELARAVLENRASSLSPAALACIQSKQQQGSRMEDGRAGPTDSTQPGASSQPGGWPFQDVLHRLVASGIAQATGRMLGEGKPLYEWTTYGRRVCQRYAQSTPMTWAAAFAARSETHCVGCGRDMCRQRGVAQHPDKKRRLCQGCVILFRMDEEGCAQALPR